MSLPLYSAPFYQWFTSFATQILRLQQRKPGIHLLYQSSALYDQNLDLITSSKKNPKHAFLATINKALCLVTTLFLAFRVLARLLSWQWLRRLLDRCELNSP
ncbi:uncharacterized protein PGTG_15644 [Puccinia graminis f. sp. tritici CRL 75-36-700-3]|uniref:Uncharacterized protein n=1 Tax=Puccinia graminis f. sp. tritici (strain CRL 75-36-700-3 / race SCCL) TaxID=418459 RepID=E3KZF6_PUCGT|nr:uncharacterized protein PGTG_15644 [Puccinia graminis f. sp. tritici CRL 75-36-700-3]EFP89681.1 hypothetical protein PGTG_15644 [Puccinia graminis f. sp. tritici CRL 75-36-700-3]